MTDIPQGDPETAIFWAAAKEGRLLIKRCAACSEPHWYPRSRCPFCGGDTVWEEASGAGSIYSFSVVPNAPAETRVIAFVSLAEGPRVMTNVIGASDEALSIGASVHVCFTGGESGQPIPRFRLTSAPAA